MRWFSKQWGGSLAAWVAATLISGTSFEAGSAAAAEAPPTRGVAFLGRIAPEGDIVKLAVPASSYPGPSPVRELLAEEGQFVTNGQPIAILENRWRLETAWKSAAAQAEVSRKRLAQVEAGAKRSDVAAQKAEVERRLAELEAAKIAFERNRNLQQLDAISKQEFERVQLNLESAQKLADSAQQTLRSLEEVRQVDIALAAAQLDAALAEAEHTQAELGQAFIIAPIDGQVLKLHVRPGEIPGSKGIADLGKTNRIVIAEVYETDVPRLKAGAAAVVTGAALAGPLRGKVTKIGWQIGPNRLFSQDPAAAADARVVEAEIQLDDPAAAARLVNARVQVVVSP